MGLAARLLLWGTSVGLALILGGLLSEIVATVYPRASRTRHGVWVGVGFCLFFPPLITWVSHAECFTSTTPAFGYLQIKLVIICFTILFGLTLLLLGPKTDDLKLPRLYARLPDVGTVRVCRLTVDDHYTEVYMNDGTRHRLLLRFADAVKEMDDTDGFCTHRSHWVSRVCIATTVKNGSREFVRLNDDTEVPVSKTYRQAVVDAGFYNL